VSSRVVVRPFLPLVMLSVVDPPIIKISAQLLARRVTQALPPPLLARPTPEEPLVSGLLQLDARFEAVRLRLKPAMWLTLEAVHIKPRVLSHVPRDIWVLRAALLALLMAHGLLHQDVPS